MQIHELLRNRRSEALAQIETLQREISEIDRMLAASESVPVMSSVNPSEIDMSRDDAVIAAIKAGNRTPAQIANYIRTKLHVDITDGSTRTRLSRLKKVGRVGNDGIGWTLSA